MENTRNRKEMKKQTSTFRHKFMSRLILFFSLSISTATISSGQEVSEAKSILQKQIENTEVVRLFESNTNRYPEATQLSIVLVDGEKSEFIGLIRSEDTLKTIDNKESVFEIGSISKVFNAVLFSHHVKEGKLQLDDKLNTVGPIPIEESPEGSEKITLTMLANHTSGLPRLPQNILPQIMWNQKNPYKDYTSVFLLEYFKNQMVLENAPGTTYSYSNLGAGTLGYIMTEVSKMSYEDLLNQYIFIPLNMSKSSRFISNFEESEVVKGRNNDGSKASNWNFTDALVALGGVNSCASDIEKFIRKNLEDDEVYNLPQQPTFTISEKMKIGLGWHMNIENGRKILWHNGGTGGYKSCLAIEKDSKKAVLILSNVSAFNKNASNIDRLCFELMKIL